MKSLAELPKKIFWAAVYFGLGVMAIPLASSLWHGMWAENGLFIVSVFGGSGAIAGALLVIVPWLIRFMELEETGDSDDVDQ